MNKDSESKLNKITFTIRDTECNSKIFGNCEICNEPVVQVYHQIKWKELYNPIINKNSKVQVSDGYGHYKCLISSRLY